MRDDVRVSLRAIGAAVAAAGGIVLWLGIERWQSFSSDVSRVFTGNPTERAMWMVGLGAACIAAGLALLLLPWRGRR